MWAASTPVFDRKRKNASNELDDLALSPIQKHEAKRRFLPKVPAGTTIELLQAPGNSRPLSDLAGITNLQPLSALPPRFSRFSSQSKVRREGICPSPYAQKGPLPSVHAQRASPSRASSAGLNSVISKAARDSKRNQSVYPELVVISDSEDESRLAENVQCKTRKSVASKRRASRRPSERASRKTDIPSVNEFVRGDRSKSRYSIRLQAEKTTRLTAVREDRRQSVFVERSEYVAFEATPVKEENTRDSGENNCSPRPIVQSDEKLGRIRLKMLYVPSTRITKFSLSAVESWKEVKDQLGCYFSRGLPALSAGMDGEPFPARCGYLKLSVKTKLDIPSSPNNIVFTVIKGKGHMKEKTNGALEKTDMNVGDTIIVPRGSAFTFINLATKNEFILGYVKHN